MNYKACCATALFLFSNAAGADDPKADAPPADLTHLSLEELMNVEVTSVSRRAEKLSVAPAAISVITADELRRSGATSIPEALRLVPGMEVARVDAHSWAINARGFNDLFANKLLVLMDGRGIYTPLFSGVYWDVQDTLLEDIERIEVIRGPGATLWGANAVNGVINIITRSARDTQGLLLAGGGGTEEQGFAAVRYGGRLGDNAYYRVYATYFNRNAAGSASTGTLPRKIILRCRAIFTPAASIKPIFCPRPIRPTRRPIRPISMWRAAMCWDDGLTRSPNDRI